MVTVIKDGPSVSVQLSANGAAARVEVVVWRRSPETTLLLDRVDIVAAEVRGRILKRLPQDVQIEASEVLENAALELAFRRAEGGEPVEPRSADPEPWLEEVEGTALIDELAVAFNQYLVLPPAVAETLAAFVLVTYVVDAFDVAPYLAVLSATLRCGKTRLLELLELLVWRPWLTTAATGPVLFRRIERVHPTLLLDEAEVVRSHGDAASIVRALLQAGYKRGAKVTRCVGEGFEDRDFDIFGPKVFAAIGRLPATVLDRTIVIMMRRRRRDEPVTRFRRREFAPQALEVRRKCQRWATDYRSALQQARPAIPEVLDDRAQEIWEPLLAVASVVGGTWPVRLSEAAESLSGQRDDESVGAELLADISTVFERMGGERIGSRELAQALGELEARPWADWSHGKPLTQNGLARLLKDFGIQPIPMWIDGKTQRGYTTVMFADAFSRYLAQDRKGTSNAEGLPLSQQVQGIAQLAVHEQEESTDSDKTAYGLTVEGSEVKGPAQGKSEPHSCVRCGRQMNHYGSDPGRGWVCAICYPDADRAMRGQ